MASVFTKIVLGEIPSYKVAESSDFLAFLDVNPLMKGHTLVIPKKEIDCIFDVEDPLYSGLWLFAKKVSAALQVAIPCQRVGVTVIGLDVPHAHIHLLPINKVSDMNLANPKIKLTDQEMKEIASKIAKAFG
jgi:histidine triad (HIT) family protein